MLRSYFSDADCTSSSIEAPMFRKRSGSWRASASKPDERRMGLDVHLRDRWTCDIEHARRSLTCLPEHIRPNPPHLAAQDGPATRAQRAWGAWARAHLGRASWSKTAAPHGASSPSDVGRADAEAAAAAASAATGAGGLPTNAGNDDADGDDDDGADDE